METHPQKVQGKCNTQNENQNNQNNCNEVEDLMLNNILCCKSANNGGALVGMCGRDEELWLSVATCLRIAMAYAHWKAIDIHCL